MVPMIRLLTFLSAHNQPCHRWYLGIFPCRPGNGCHTSGSYIPGRPNVSTRVLIRMELISARSSNNRIDHLYALTRQGRAPVITARDDGRGRGVAREVREVNGASSTSNQIRRVLIIVSWHGPCGDNHHLW
jgi:hypothetical protein